MNKGNTQRLDRGIADATNPTTKVAARNRLHTTADRPFTPADARAKPKCRGLAFLKTWATRGATTLGFAFDDISEPGLSLPFPAGASVMPSGDPA